jgi:hypothetical protein
VGTTPVALGGALAGPTGGLEPPTPRPVISILSVSSVTSTAPASSLTIPAFQRRRRIASPSSLGRSRAATSLSARPGDESAWKPSPISIAATRRRRLCRAVRRSAAGFRAIVGELEELRSGARRAADEAGSFYLRRTSRHPGPAVPAGSSARLLGHFARFRFSARGLEPGSQEVYGGHALGWAWACRLLIAAGRSESGRPGGHQLVVVLVEPEPCPRDKPGYSLRPKLIPLCTKAALTEKTTPGEVHQESTRLSPPVIVSHFLSRGSGARSDLR